MKPVIIADVEIITDKVTYVQWHAKRVVHTFYTNVNSTLKFSALILDSTVRNTAWKCSIVCNSLLSNLQQEQQQVGTCSMY